MKNPQPSLTPGGCLAYRLDANRLNWMQRERLLNHLVRRERMTANDARLLVVEGLPIPTHDAAIVSEFEQEQVMRPAPAFVLSGRVMRPALFVLECSRVKQ